jgi:hypothetical protein
MRDLISVHSTNEVSVVQCLTKIFNHLSYLGYETQDYLSLLRKEIEAQVEELGDDVEIELLEEEGMAEEQEVYLAEQNEGTPAEIMILVFKKSQKIVFRVNMDREKSRLDDERLFEIFNLLNDSFRGAPKIFYDADREEIAIETVWFGDFYRQRLFLRFFNELSEFCNLALGKVFLEPEEDHQTQAERLERLLEIEYNPDEDEPESPDD